MRTQCCVVGGGPAGMMLGFLLARAGVEVIVLEKHKDFLRDFRGDTIHPSTLNVIAKGSAERLKQAGIAAFRESLVRLMPFLPARLLGLGVQPEHVKTKAV